MENDPASSMLQHYQLMLEMVQSRISSLTAEIASKRTELRQAMEEHRTYLRQIKKWQSKNQQ